MIDFSTVQGVTIPEGVVTKITDSAGNILWQGLISFTIAGTQYYAEKGMTWKEWVSSSYNTGGITITSFLGTELVKIGTLVYVGNPDNTYVATTDEITNGTAYISKYFD